MWKYYIILLMIVALLGMPGVARAATSVNVTIYAAGLVYFPNAPEGFTIYYVSDYEVGFTWEKPATANKTLIRAAFGREPEDVDDGYEVYFGTATNCTDTAVAVHSPENVYYRAWSQDLGGNWSVLASSGNTEGFMSASFLFIGLLGMALTLTLACFRWKDILLSYAAALTWLAIGFWWAIDDIANLSLADPWSKILVFIPFLMFIVIMLRLMGTEIEMERKGFKWREFGSKPSEETESKSEAYKRELRKKLRR